MVCLSHSACYQQNGLQLQGQGHTNWACRDQLHQSCYLHITQTHSLYTDLMQKAAEDAYDKPLMLVNGGLMQVLQPEGV